MQDLLQRFYITTPSGAGQLLRALAVILAVAHAFTLVVALGFMGELRHFLPGLTVATCGATLLTVFAIKGVPSVWRKIYGANLETIAEHVNDGLVLLKDKKVLFSNAQARKLIGSVDPSSGLTDEMEGALLASSTSEAPVLHETSIDGRKRQFLVSRIKLPNETIVPGRGLCVLVFQDVTFLRESEEAKINFIGTLSHEIKTPITSLAMALAMLERTGYDAELVRIANADVTRLRVLLEDLLSVSKLKIVKSPNALQKHEVNLTALVNRAVKEASVAAFEKGIEIEASVESSPAIIADIDPTKITWVVTTLLTDAIRQAPADKPVRVNLELHGKTGHFSIEYEQRGDIPGPTGHAIVRDIIEAHAGAFSARQGHGRDAVNSLNFSIHAHARQGHLHKGDRGDETHLVG